MLQSGFTIKTQKEFVKPCEYNVNFIIDTTALYDYFKISVEDSKNLIRLDEIEVKGNPPTEFTMAKICQTINNVNELAEIVLKIEFKKKYDVVKRKKKVVFAYQI